MFEFVYNIEILGENWDKKKLSGFHFSVENFMRMILFLKYLTGYQLSERNNFDKQRRRSNFDKQRRTSKWFYPKISSASLPSQGAPRILW